MSIITLDSVQAWAGSRINLESLNAELVNQIASQVINKAAQVFDTTRWTEAYGEIPPMIKSIISMQVAGRELQMRAIDSVDDTSYYGTKLIKDSENILDSILTGVILIKDNLGVVITPAISMVGGVSSEPEESDPYFSMDMTF